MVFYEYDPIDDMYDVDKYYIYYAGDIKITTADAVYELESCCHQVRRDVYSGTSTTGAEVEIPLNDVISFQGEKICGGA